MIIIKQYRPVFSTFTEVASVLYIRLIINKYLNDETHFVINAIKLTVCYL